MQPFKPFSLGVGSTRDKNLKVASNPCMIQVDPRNDPPSKTEKVELNDLPSNCHTMLITDGVELIDQCKYIPTNYTHDLAMK